ncbi:MAG: hypothetical protein ACP5HM_11045 [Anaerolineae bacterium]
MMDHTAKLVKGFIINSAIFVGLTLALLFLNRLLREVWLDTLYLVILFGLGGVQFFANMVLSLILWKREQPDVAWATAASGTVVPMVCILVIYGVAQLIL